LWLLSLPLWADTLYIVVLPLNRTYRLCHVFLGKAVASYWSKFPKATASGWTDPSFFPISVFIGNPQDATAWHNMGVNLYMAVNHDVTDTSYSPLISRATDPDKNPATNDGVFVLPNKDYEDPNQDWKQSEVGNDPKAVGWFVTDECDQGYSGCGNATWTEYQQLSTQISRSNAIKAYNDGRFQWSNFGNGVARNFASPNTMDEHVKLMDGSSGDKYTYTSPNSADTLASSRYWPQNASSNVAAGYGWMIDQLRDMQLAETSPGDPTPAEPEGLRPEWAFVETAMPYLFGEPGARTITPDQMEGAVWSALIHEARGVAYFTFSNDPCDNQVLYAGNTSATCQQQLTALQNKFKSVNSSIKSLAPVLNTQSYVWDFSNDGNLTNNSDTMLKTYNGSAYIFAGIGLNYTGTDTSQCDIINLKNICQRLGSNQSTGTKNFILPWRSYRHHRNGSW
jgi:hypothetical protein